ncbi:Polyadenylate-binding protein, cytoplasmic and nuclear [Psilocybe cubensis]|uniref:Polyadenylate-binding protein, cytoplasmic and nuclear n=2 Tax=Psilocybe cubensis TaxID=181762 RepID=A0ACB8GRP8_PSICU|nr:Polyadenylate-binding protein, cytoplasmic and nuclear [Psilocybe cubensis]KAH9478313.1 Polyadenylate-binding protein, cytoplasmic and nuclear [Psilocybe cubensis]
MDPNYNQQYQESGPRPHPYLHEPLLYITNIPPYITDENLAMAFVNCGPFRPKIQRDGSQNLLSGTIEFKFLDKAEKALTILQSRNIPETMPPVPLVLSPYPPTNPPTPLPPPSALPRLVKQLPPDYTDSQLYDIFRPFGALASAQTHTQFGPDVAMIEFWNEEDAIHAEEAMHCAEIEGQNISVQLYQPLRRSLNSPPEFNVAAPTFIPSGLSYSPYPTQYSPHSPPRANPYSPVRSPIQAPVPFLHGPGQQVQLAPSNGPGSASHSGLIDPCNLFCKNLSPEIDSNSLFAHFSRFGQIVSARVMRNENGDSRGFGFVSYHQPEHAAEAMRVMNGTQLGTKQIVVRLHEPKQLRQEKLAHRFSNNGHPRRSSSGATSPTASEAGDYSGWNSPRTYSTSLVGSPALSPKPATHFERPERGRRGSASYYTAALNGTLNVPMTYNSLSTLSPVVRKEVLTGELSRRLKAMEAVEDSAVDSIVESIVNLSLSNVLQYLDDPAKLADQVDSYKSKHPKVDAPEPVATPAGSDRASQDSRGLDVNPATASAPEHPSTPVSVSPSLLTPPRTSSPAGSVPPMSERDRIYAAISKLESSRQTELTELIMSLPKRERAMCLFNAEVLRLKLVDAKMVLDSADEEDVSPPAATDAQSTKSAPAPVPVTPQAKKIAPPAEASPRTPDLSSRGPSVTASPTPVTPASNASASAHTIASLAKLPAAEIVRLANSSSATGLPLPKADPLIVQATDEFIDGLLDKQIQVQKQALGEKLFKVIKSLGVKGAPKITIALLDQEDLRALAHLMNSYTPVLKEKALALAVTK